MASGPGGEAFEAEGDAFTNPISDVAIDPTAESMPADSAAPPRASTDEEVAGVAEEPEHVLDGQALGFLGPENPLRVALFKATTHR